MNSGVYISIYLSLLVLEIICFCIIYSLSSLNRPKNVVNVCVDFASVSLKLNTGITVTVIYSFIATPEPGLLGCYNITAINAVAN